MRRLSALVAVTAMATSLVAPSMVSANRNDVRYYPSGQTTRYYSSAQAGGCVSGRNTSSVRYVPSSSVQYLPAGAVRVMEPGRAVSGSRVFYISDNPRYDLSGANESVFLVEDGSTYRTSSGRTPVAYVASLGAYTAPQVVAVPSEYRQDWLAVAAGDRPVRCIPAAGTMAAPTTMTMVPVGNATYTSYTTTPTNRGYTVTTTTSTRRPWRHHAYRRTTYSNASRNHVYRRRVRMTNASYRPARSTKVVTRTYTPASTNCVMSTNTAAVAVASQPMATHDVYQIGNSWYMEDGGAWSRSDSWKGPFFRVKKGHVPREVRESRERDHDTD